MNKFLLILIALSFAATTTASAETLICKPSRYGHNCRTIDAKLAEREAIANLDSNRPGSQQEVKQEAKRQEPADIVNNIFSPFAMVGRILNKAIHELNNGNKK